MDHRGGRTNFLAIDRESLAVVGLRDDDQVVAVNTQPGKFKPVHFHIPELIGRFAWSDWLNFVNSDWVRDMVYISAGDWGNYIKAAMLRLQHKYQDLKIRGANIALSGDVPIAAGTEDFHSVGVRPELPVAARPSDPLAPGTASPATSLSGQACSDIQLDPIHPRSHAETCRYRLFQIEPF